MTTQHTRNTRPWRSVGPHLLAALLIPLAACGSTTSTKSTAVAAQAVADPNPLLADVPRPGQAPLRSFVGLNAGQALGVNIGGTTGDQVTAYLCDGAAVSKWFTGTIDPSGTITAKSAGGETLTATISGDSLTATIGSTSHSLHAATLNSGLYRETTTVDGATFVSGWILTNEGRLVGATGTKNQVVAGSNSSLDDASGSAPAETPPTTVAAVPSVLFLGLRCGVLGFVQGRGLAKANQQSTPPSAGSPGQAGPVSAATQFAIDRGKELGCNPTAGNGAT